MLPLLRFGLATLRNDGKSGKTIRNKNNNACSAIFPNSKQTLLINDRRTSITLAHRFFASKRDPKTEINDVNQQNTATKTKKPRRKTEKDHINLFMLKNYVFFPKCALQLRIFEPRYLIMLDQALNYNFKHNPTHAKRQIDASSKLAQFGIVSSAQDEFNLEKPQEYGTLASVLRHYEDKDNTSLITVFGARRFRIKNPDKSMLGIWESDIEYFDDVTPTPEELEESVKIAAKIISILKSKIEPEYWETITKMGIIPDIRKRTEDFSFFIASVSPFTKDQKLELLKMTSAKDRLTRIMELYSEKIHERTTEVAVLPDQSTANLKQLKTKLKNAVEKPKQDADEHSIPSSEDTKPRRKAVAKKKKKDQE